MDNLINQSAFAARLKEHETFLKDPRRGSRLVLDEALIIDVKTYETAVNQAVLTSCAFQGCSFVKSDLKQVDLELSHMNNSSFDESDLTCAVFRGVRMRHSSLSNAVLKEIDLSPAKLKRADGMLNSDLDGTNFEHSDMQNANMEQASLQHANLFECNLSGANLAGANLAEANLAGANLAGVNFKGADLSNAELRNASLKNANLEGAKLDGAKGFFGILTLPIDAQMALEAHVIWVMSEGKEGTRAELQASSFAEQDLAYAELTCADLREVNFEKCNLKGAYLAGADLRQAVLTGADIEGADLRGANLSGAILDGVELSKARTDNLVVKTKSASKVVTTQIGT